MGTAMRGQRPALASLLAWVAMLALLLGTLPLLPLGQAGMAVQMPLEERGGEGALQEEAPAAAPLCCRSGEISREGTPAVAAGQPMAAHRA